MSGRCRFYSNIALARSPPLTAAVKVESVVGRQGKMADVGRASIRRGSAEYYFQNITNIQPCLDDYGPFYDWKIHGQYMLATKNLKEKDFSITKDDLILHAY